MIPYNYRDRPPNFYNYIIIEFNHFSKKINNLQLLKWSDLVELLYEETVNE